MTTTTTIAVPTSCAALRTKLAELAQRIDDELAQAGSGEAIDYGALEQRVADALGEIERGLHAQVPSRRAGDPGVGRRVPAHRPVRERLPHAHRDGARDANGVPEDGAQRRHARPSGTHAKGDVRGLCRGLSRDVTALRAQRPDLKIACLTDGATEFETLYEQHLATPLGPDVVSLVDLGEARAVSPLAACPEARRWRRGADPRTAGAERPREGHA
jgi:hypothetical protein